MVKINAGIAKVKIALFKKIVQKIDHLCDRKSVKLDRYRAASTTTPQPKTGECYPANRGSVADPIVPVPESFHVPVTGMLDLQSSSQSSSYDTLVFN
uniref:Uncharacterized protein n=1 Tax=Tetranychus urticae TaxID=32264 RepID=T1KDD9_TETUR